MFTVSVRLFKSCSFSLLIKPTWHTCIWITCMSSSFIIIYILIILALIFCISFMLIMSTSLETVLLHSLCVVLPRIKLSLVLLELFLFSVLYLLFHYTKKYFFYFVLFQNINLFYKPTSLRWLTFIVLIHSICLCCHVNPSFSVRLFVLKALLRSTVCPCGC